GGSGGGPECVVPADCDDYDACTLDTCKGGKCSYAPRDLDQDGHVDVACGGDDCNDLNPNVFPGHQEICNDAADNNCNGVADCLDPACKLAPGCGCVPAPGGENCTNGKDDDCDQTVDCNDTDCMNTPACGCVKNEKGACGDGFDNDCDKKIDCDDADCKSDPVCVCQAKQEICDNKKDEDCDLLIDCADPDCWGMQACICQPPGKPESCADGKDNDCDGMVDCADLDCLASPSCKVCTAEKCDDGLDNNCNNLIDCADPACFFAPNCTAKPEICNNNLDDDNDTLIDCADPDCANNPVCVIKQSNCLTAKLIPATGTYTGDTTGNVNENHGSCGGDAGEAVFYFVLTKPARVHVDSVGTSFDSTLYVRAGSCEDGKELGCDDDSGGYQWSAALDFSILYPGTYFVFLDGYTVDPELGANEGPFVLNVEIEENPKEKCADGKDNDGDIYVDCADPDCVNAPNCYLCNGGKPPGPEFGVAACTDGKDNDCDGTTDCGDDDCSASDYYVTECCDGKDENGNLIPDDFNCRCVSDKECMPGEICYTHTAHACGYPCDQFFGQICPFVAPGSYCNLQTQQCEF
ncbi:MAG: hypothetical protein HY744_28740, partial [Deltaproteobacteria bacterium]|nr:hypothetical protein [Deltaproteobacteria bacterium]